MEQLKRLIYNQVLTKVGNNYTYKKSKLSKFFLQGTLQFKVPYVIMYMSVHDSDRKRF